MVGQFSRSELLQMMDLATRCLRVTSPEDLGAIMSSLNGLATFDKAALCAISGTESEISLAHFVNHSYGAKWAELYVDQNFQRVDPVLAYARTTNGAFHWAEAPSPAAQKGGAAFLEAAEAFGLVDGISFSCADRSPASRSVLSLARVPADEFERTREILTTIGPHLHEAYRKVLQPQPASEKSVELSAREREVLNWAQEGKTYWEIGGILGISARTVKFHVSRIKSKLDVVSTSHAVAMAMRMGLIS